ncbi:MAG TPA: Flp family type IVb pilin [Dehalococcoidia bacterium]|nr:Flp family type IVb pilin [Dehalococcoidia bacterium]
MYALISVVGQWLKMHVRSERGQDLIEYAMLGGLLAIAIAAAVFLLSGAIGSMATGIGNCIDFNSGTVCAPF